MAGKAVITGKIQQSLGETITQAGLSTGAQFIIIGDTDHTNRAVRAAVSSKDLVDGLSAGGATLLLIEAPRELDDLAQQYRSEEIRREEFFAGVWEKLQLFNNGEVSKEEMINSFADTIDAARENHMEVRFIDRARIPYVNDSLDLGMYAVERYAEERGEEPRYDEDYVSEAVAYGMENYFSDEQKALLTDFARATSLGLAATQRYAQESGEEPQFNSAYIAKAIEHGYNNGYFTAEEKGVLLKVSQDFAEQRLDDTQLAEDITEAAAGQTTGVIYGSWHDDLAAKLGRDNVLIFDVHPNQTAFDNSNPQDRPGFKPEGEPDFVYFPDKGVFVTDRATPAATAGLTEVGLPDAAPTTPQPAPSSTFQMPGVKP